MIELVCKKQPTTLVYNTRKSATENKMFHVLHYNRIQFEVSFLHLCSQCIGKGGQTGADQIVKKGTDIDGLDFSQWQTC